MFIKDESCTIDRDGGTKIFLGGKTIFVSEKKGDNLKGPRAFVES